MGRLLVILGILAIIGSAAGLIWLLQPPQSNPPLADLLEDLHCRQYEQIEQRSQTTISGTSRSTSVYYYCVDLERGERDVSGAVVSMIIIAFLVPFLLGLFMTIFGAARATRNHQRRLVNQMAAAPMMVTTFTTSAGPIRPMGQPSGTALPDLAERLEQIEEARDKGLISTTEYNRLRQAILDRMDD